MEQRANSLIEPMRKRKAADKYILRGEDKLLRLNEKKG